MQVSWKFATSNLRIGEPFITPNAAKVNSRHQFSDTAIILKLDIFCCFVREKMEASQLSLFFFPSQLLNKYQEKIWLDSNKLGMGLSTSITIHVAFPPELHVVFVLPPFVNKLGMGLSTSITIHIAVPPELHVVFVLPPFVGGSFVPRSSS